MAINRKKQILEYTVCNFQVVSLKREFFTVFQCYLGTRKVRIADLFCGHFRPRWRKLKFNKPFGIVGHDSRAT